MAIDDGFNHPRKAVHISVSLALKATETKIMSFVKTYKKGILYINFVFAFHNGNEL